MSTTAQQTVNWGGHTFTVYLPSTSWNDASGVYIFAGKNSSGRWVAYYVGQAKSFKDRLTNHERWAEAKRLGATHIHAKSVARQADRGSIESQLIATYRPPLNTQGK